MGSGSERRVGRISVAAAVAVALIGAIPACAVDKLLNEPEPGNGQSQTPVASQLAFTSQPEGAAAGDALAPVVVAARDQNGQPATDFVGAVTISLAGSGSSAGLRGTLERQAVGGIATFDDLSLTRAGSGYQIQAQAAGLTTATSDPFDVAAAPATHLASSGGDKQADTVAATLASPYVVTLTDGFGNPISGASVAWAVVSGGGTVDPPSAVTDPSGAAQAFHTLGTKSGSQTVSATASGVGSAVTFTATASHGAVATVRFSAQPTDVRKDRPINPPVVVITEDQFGNRTTGFTGSIEMSLTPFSGNIFGQLSGTLTRTANGGQATFDDLRINQAGAGYRLRVAAENHTADSQPFTVRRK